MKILRQGQEQAVHVKVAELKAERVAASGGIIEESLGLVVQELTPAMARSLQVTDIKGLVATHAEEVGMRWDDVLVEVNQQKGETSAITRPHSDASAVRILRQCCSYALEEMSRMWR